MDDTSSQVSRVSAARSYAEAMKEASESENARRQLLHRLTQQAVVVSRLRQERALLMHALETVSNIPYRASLLDDVSRNINFKKIPPIAYLCLAFLDDSFCLLIYFIDQVAQGEVINDTTLLAHISQPLVRFVTFFFSSKFSPLSQFRRES
jgi:hypothetical protein